MFDDVSDPMFADHFEIVRDALAGSIAPSSATRTSAGRGLFAVVEKDVGGRDVRAQLLRKIGASTSAPPAA